MKFIKNYEVHTLLGQIPALILPWYRANARELPWRRDQDPYRVWLSEIMLQQTRVEAVRGYYTRFLDALPTIPALAQADDDRLLKLWEGLGYYNRAKNLKRAAQVIVTEYGGVFPHTHREILALPGIGPYTAGAIGSICFGLPYPAVDGNVLRVYARLMATTDCVDIPAVRMQITENLSHLYHGTDPGALNQAIMELGATICLPNGAPRCGDCPLVSLCRAQAAGTQLAYPVRAKKKARRMEEKTVFILTSGETLAVEKRGDTGLLGGLWALPNVPGQLDEDAALALAASWGVEPLELTRSSQKKHVFTHVEWHMIGYYIQCRTQSARFVWADKDMRSDRVALPTAFRQFLG
ncbi:MAG: A/G-specific adenine glycosylase [Oscillospiraceae bacterium]|nr:A/G-specific adenine glycosylase [Oscillospiraceae bacterium]